MAYLFRQGESPSSAIKRINLELIDYILEQLKDSSNNRDEAVHESRKSFKQLRALLRLVRAETGEKFYQANNALYGDLASQLAPLRDSFVRIETLDKLGVDAVAFRKEMMKEYRIIRRRLLTKGGVVTNVIRQLEAHRPSAESWDIDSDKFKVLGTGLERSYQQGQKRLKDAFKLQGSEAFHDWRKAVKNLLYHCRLIEPVSPELTSYVAELKELSEILGEANDFAGLAVYCTEHGQEGLLPIIQKRLAALLDAAEPLGKALYKEDCTKFITQIKADWKKWQAVAA